MIGSQVMHMPHWLSAAIGCERNTSQERKQPAHLLNKSSWSGDESENAAESDDECIAEGGGESAAESAAKSSANNGSKISLKSG